MVVVVATVPEDEEEDFLAGASEGDLLLARFIAATSCCSFSNCRSCARAGVGAGGTISVRLE